MLRKSLPEFDEWANEIVSEVNSNVTQALPNFTEWADGIAQSTYQLLFQSYPNFTEQSEKIQHTTKDSVQKLVSIVNALSNLQDTSTSTAGVVDELLLIAQELLALHNESTPLPISCQELKSQFPSSLSGYYVLATDNETYTAYCNMEQLCGSGGGWTRLAYLNMNDAAEDCPSGFRLYQSGGVRACGRPNSGCVSIIFPSQNLSYSQICGRVKGYQYGSTDAIKPSYIYSYWHRYNIRNNIDTYYVDGVSITRGSYREHVWTLMSGYAEDSTVTHACPCNTGNSVSVLSFIGNNYFCESGSYGYASVTLYTNDTLWDGQDCFSNEAPCCNVPGIPWFHRDYGSATTTDYIELRVCGDESPSNEDAPVSYYEIYVK
uniref:Fibrinogen C-terminal domain-containing protein n=1 Tax=Amphimedon queenslandica TaxID=400682 RepID=A0A1X7T9N3_AMPQE